MVDRFLSRWSRRKLDAKEGRLAEPEPPAAAPPAPRVAERIDPVLEPEPAPETVSQPNPPAIAEAPAPPTLEDVALLSQESDFSRFMASDVDRGVKNAAMKKLFSDPRYNVMDGLDVYVDDYSKSDPIPESMLRKLAASQFLKLFEEEHVKKPDKDELLSREVANNVAPQKVAHSNIEDLEVPARPPDVDTDLRLQQDDAPPGQEPGSGNR